MSPVLILSFLFYVASCQSKFSYHDTIQNGFKAVSPQLVKPLIRKQTSLGNSSHPISTNEMTVLFLSYLTHSLKVITKLSARSAPHLAPHKLPKKLAAKQNQARGSKLLSQMTLLNYCSKVPLPKTPSKHHSLPEK